MSFFDQLLEDEVAGVTRVDVKRAFVASLNPEQLALFEILLVDPDEDAFWDLKVSLSDVQRAALRRIST